jgi:hypothetical protein
MLRRLVEMREIAYNIWRSRDTVVWYKIGKNSYGTFTFQNSQGILLPFQQKLAWDGINFDPYFFTGLNKNPNFPDNKRFSFIGFSFKSFFNRSKIKNYLKKRILFINYSEIRLVSWVFKIHVYQNLLYPSRKNWDFYSSE